MLVGFRVHGCVECSLGLGLIGMQAKTKGDRKKNASGRKPVSLSGGAYDPGVRCIIA